MRDGRSTSCALTDYNLPTGTPLTNARLHRQPTPRARRARRLEHPLGDHGDQDGRRRLGVHPRRAFWASFGLHSLLYCTAEINGGRGKKQEFNFRVLVATAADLTFIADGDNILAFDNVTQASKAVVLLNTGEQVCWTPPGRVSPGGPSVIEKTNTQCMSSINLDYSTSGNWN